MYESVITGECNLTNTPECPCILANLQECQVCSHLQGEDFCDCQWTNSCVYLNYKFEKKSYNETPSDKLYRIKTISVSKDCYLVYLKAPVQFLNGISTLTKAYLWPGSQLKSYRFPVIILRTYPEEGIITAAFHSSCALDKSVFFNTDEFALECFKEPVILGLKHLLEKEKQKVLIYADAFGQLLLEQLTTGWLLPQSHQISIYCDDQLAPWIAKKLEKLPISIYTAKSTSLKAILTETNPDYCCSLGDRLKAKKLACLLVDIKLNIPLAVSIFD